MKPPKSILDPEFEYISSDDTNIRLRFDKIRRLQLLIDLAAKRAQDADNENTRKVLTIFEARRGK